MAIIGYQADLDPHGRVNGYEFQRDDGSSTYAFGPDADDLARELDAQNQAVAMGAVPQVHAFNGGGGGSGGMSGMSDGSSSQGAGEALPPPPDYYAGGYSQAPAPAPPPAMQSTADYHPEALPAEPAPAGGYGAPVAAIPTLPVDGVPGEPGADADGFAPDPLAAEINAPVRVGGSPGVNPMRMREQGVYVPDTRTTTEAQPFDEQAAEDRANAEIDLRLAHQDRVDFENAKMERSAEILRQQQPELVKAALEAQRVVVERENLYKRDRAHLQKLIDDQRARRVDPTKLYTEKGTLGTIGLVLMQGFGAWAAGMNGGPNYAAEIINAGVEQNIRAQEAEIQAGQAGVDNALGELEREYGDMEQAKQALRIRLHDVADNKAQEVAAQLGTIESGIALKEWTALREAERGEREAEFRRLSLGKQSVHEKLIQPKAASGGGYRAPTLKERAERAGYAGKINEYEAARTGKAVGTEGRKREEFDEKSLQSLSERMDPIVKLDEANKAVSTKGVESTLSANVVPDAVAGIHPEGGKVSEQRRAWNAWLNARVHQLGGASMPPEEFARLRAGLENSLKTKESREGALGDAQAAVDQQKRNILSGYPARVREEWERRNKQVTSETAGASGPTRKK